MIGHSPAIVAIRAEIEALADSGASVLITGPSGSGKDVVAQLLRQRSRRASRPFIALDCAAVARDLLGSELFGHEAGAFTGAIKARPGRFEAADGGTLFLSMNSATCRSPCRPSCFGHSKRVLSSVSAACCR